MIEPIIVECSVDFDDEWIQEDCHWDYKRFFIITWKIWSGPLKDISTGNITGLGQIYSSKLLYYRLDNINYNQAVSPEHYNRQVDENAKWNSQYTRKLETFTYRLDFSSVADDVLLAARTSEGWLPISAFATLDSSSDKLGLITNSDYYLELPPERITNLNIALVSNSLITTDPSELRCSWNKPNIAGGYNGNSGVDSVDGYCIEFEHKPASAEDFQYLTGLAWVDGVDRYLLKKTDDSNIEVYLENPAPDADKTPTEFYFNPKHLGVKPGDEYQITIYPYSHFEGALLAAEGTEPKNGKVPKGIVRVKVSKDSWAEGQVWVMTDKGWKEAESIYTRTNSGWTEAV